MFGCRISKVIGGRQKRLIFFMFGSLISKGFRVGDRSGRFGGVRGELLAPRLIASNIVGHTPGAEP
jgi:hypothetical protein